MDVEQVAINLLASIDAKTPEQSALLAWTLAKAMETELDRRQLQSKIQQLQDSRKSRGE